MASQRLAMFKAMLPKIPLVLRVALLHALRVSQQSKYLDLRTELVVAVIRSFIVDVKTPPTVTSAQQLSLRDPGIKGRIWVAKYTAPAPDEDEDVRKALLAAIEGLATDPRLADVIPDPVATAAAAPVRLPDLVPVEAEWTGYRAGASKAATLPPISEQERFREMMRECTSPVTILYFHGGAYWLMDPSSHRAVTKKLAKLTKGRVYSVRYRLAPQNPFPSALLDALVSYLTLLYPPPGAFHEPVHPANLVFAGDSAGGNLCFALTQTLLELRRQERKISWLGAERDLPLPAGVAASSPWMDVLNTLPSWQANSRWDYLPSSRLQDDSKRPRCAAWPPPAAGEDRTPRRHMFVDDGMVLHPLVSPVAAPLRCWEGCPPLYMSTGWEMLADEDKYMAARLARAGVAVVFEEYEAMPHCFALVVPFLKGAQRCYRSWAGHITRVANVPVPADGEGQKKEEEEVAPVVKTSFTTILAKSLKEVSRTAEEVAPCSEEEMKARLTKRLPELYPDTKVVTSKL